jgi:hypothetical protein
MVGGRQNESQSLAKMDSASHVREEAQSPGSCRLLDRSPGPKGDRCHAATEPRHRHRNSFGSKINRDLTNPWPWIKCKRQERARGQSAREETMLAANVASGSG